MREVTGRRAVHGSRRFGRRFGSRSVVLPDSERCGRVRTRLGSRQVESCWRDHDVFAEPDGGGNSAPPFDFCASPLSERRCFRRAGAHGRCASPFTFDMTRSELRLAVTRHNRMRGAIVSVALLSLIVWPWFATQSGIHPIAFLLGMLTIPWLVLALTIPAMRRYGVRCPNCHVQLGLEKKRVYDVVSTGTCRKCGASVVEPDAGPNRRPAL
jgi:hypothetical protein